MDEILEVRKIKTASLKKGRTVDVKFTRLFHSSAGNVEPKCSEAGETLAHEDLLNAFKALEPHLISVCEMPGMPEDFKVSGFAVSEGNEGEGVVISGSRKLSTGKNLNLTSPMVEYYGDDYAEGSALESDIQVCINEIQLYLDGKCAIKQVEINFDEGDEDAEVNISVEGEKKKRKKKIKVEAFVDGGGSADSLEPFEQN